MTDWVDFRHPLSGALYRSFLTYSRSIASSICVIVLDGTQAEGKTPRILERLQPWFISTREVRQWPGTRIEDPADIAFRYTFELSGDVVDLMCGFAADIYA